MQKKTYVNLNPILEEIIWLIRKINKTKKCTKCASAAF